MKGGRCDLRITVGTAVDIAETDQSDSLFMPDGRSAYPWTETDSLHDPKLIPAIHAVRVLRDVDIVTLQQMVLGVLMPLHLEIASRFDARSGDVTRNGVSSTGRIVILVVEVSVMLGFTTPTVALPLLRLEAWRSQVCGRGRRMGRWIRSDHQAAASGAEKKYRQISAYRRRAGEEKGKENLSLASLGGWRRKRMGKGSPYLCLADNGESSSSSWLNSEMLRWECNGGLYCGMERTAKRYMALGCDISFNLTF
jgi:hypothetical protein